MQVQNIPDISTIPHSQHETKPVAWQIGLSFGWLTMVLEGLAILFLVVWSSLPPFDRILSIIIAMLGIGVGGLDLLLWNKFQRQPAHIAPSTATQRQVTYRDMRQKVEAPKIPSVLPSTPAEDSQLQSTLITTQPIPTGHSTAEPNIHYNIALATTINVFTPDLHIERPRSQDFPVPKIRETRWYGLPKEGSDLSLSADKKAYQERGIHFRYALADGVSTSFLPGKWAQILTDAFVARDNDFADAEDFEQWLRQCSQDWHTWVRETWVEQAKQKTGQDNWEREIARGASATFIGCSFSQAELLHKGTTQVQVTAVGDADFFLISRSPDPASSGQFWTHQSYFLTHAEQFGPVTETLGSPERRVQRDWKRVHIGTFQAHLDNYIVLTTDALAKWVLELYQAGKDPWQRLLSIETTKDLKTIVDCYRNKGELEVDDTTIMIIPLCHRATPSG